ncbi:hypothetical protein DOY81_002741, partial [Sarcophaga bullata]
KMAFILKVLLLFGVFLSTNIERVVQAKEILCIFGVPTETTEKWNNVLLTSLSNRGHGLTVVTPTIKWDLETEANIDFIFLENTRNHLEQRYENRNAVSFMDQSVWKSLIHWYDQHMATCQGNLESKGFSDILQLALKQKHKFDLIIYDLTYGPGCLLHLVDLFENVPLVGITSSSLTSDILNINPQLALNPALDPYVLSDFTQNMNYWQRLYNTALFGFDYLYRRWVVQPVIEGLWSHSTHANSIVPKSLHQILPRFKVILVNHHPALHTLKALPSNIITVAGLHVDADISNQLDSSLMKFVEKFSSGSILIDLDMQQLHENQLQYIFQVMHKLPKYVFVWLTKENKRSLKDKPNNLILAHNLQNENILSLERHIKCFLTTPEILRIQESLYYGVPMVTLSQRPEHRYLAKRSEEQGFTSNLNGNYFDAISLHSSLQQCLSDKSLTNKAKQLQLSLRQQQNPPLETAVWWLEHIMATPQLNDHLLKQKERNSNIFVYNSLDIFLLFEILILMCVINTILVCRQTILNFKKISKAKRKEIEKKEPNLEKLKKKEKKNKSKTA